MSINDDADAWARHRPAVVAAVSTRVRDVDPEAAADRALGSMRRLAEGGTRFVDPLAFWRRAALHEALLLAHDVPAGSPVGPGVRGAAGGAAGGAGGASGGTPTERIPVVSAAAALGAELQEDVAAMRRALGALTVPDRSLLWRRHVEKVQVRDIAAELDVATHTATDRQRRAEERLAVRLAAESAAVATSPACRSARSDLPGYVTSRFGPRRRDRLEQHLDECPACTRLLVDVREVAWTLQAVAPWLAVDDGSGALLGVAPLAGDPAPATRAAWWRRPAAVGTAAVVSVLAAAGLASAMVLGGGDAPPSDDAAVAPGTSASASVGSIAGTLEGTSRASGATTSSAPAAEKGASTTTATATSTATADPSTPTPTDDVTSSADAASAGDPSASSGSVSGPLSGPSGASSASSGAAGSPSGTPSGVSSGASDGTPSSSASTPAASGTTTTTVEISVKGLAAARYKVVPTAGAEVTDVSATGAEVWVDLWEEDGYWHVRLLSKGGDHVVTVTLEGPAGASASLVKM